MLLVVGGWYVVHRLSARRDSDKARREMVAKAADALMNSVDSILAASIKYHTTDRDLDSEFKIKSGLQDVALHLGELAKVCNRAREVLACSAALGQTRRAITSAHFEDEHLQPLDGGSPLVQAIAAAVTELKRRLAGLKYSQF